MKQKLTIKNVQALKPTDKPYQVWDTDIQGFFLRVQPTGVMTYYLYYRNQDGKERRFRIGKGLTATQARDAAQLNYADVVKGIDIYERAKNQKISAKKATQTQYIKFLDSIYKPWLFENRNSGKNAYNRLKSSFAILHNKQLEDITHWDIELWRKKRKKTGVTDQTLKNDFAELRAMIARAKRWKHINTNPIYDYKSPKVPDNTIVRYLSDEERERLYGALDNREENIRCDRKSGNKWREDRGYELLPSIGDHMFADYLKPLVTLALYTGMRRGELFKLTWGNVDFIGSKITVASNTAKSKKSRIIPMLEEVKKTLTIWKNQRHDQSNYVFIGKKGKQLTDISKSWKNLLKRSDIENFRFHDTRHDFASQLAIEGEDLYVIKTLLGHSTIQMTERYAHLTDKQLGDAVNKLNKFKNYGS